MDTRTGVVYESMEAAKLAGVNVVDIMEVAKAEMTPSQAKRFLADDQPVVRRKDNRSKLAKKAREHRKLVFPGTKNQRKRARRKQRGNQ